MTKISEISVRGDHFFQKILVPHENNGPTCATSESRLLLFCALDRVEYYAKVDGYMFECIVLACLL